MTCLSAPQESSQKMYTNKYDENMVHVCGAGSFPAFSTRIPEPEHNDQFFSVLRTLSWLEFEFGSSRSRVQGSSKQTFSNGVASASNSLSCNYSRGPCSYIR
jgi:hypothetical protein